MQADRSASRDEITSAIRRYLDVLEIEPQATLYELAKSLDALIAIYHRTVDVEPGGVEPAPIDPLVEKRIGEAVAARFPELGLYALAEPDGGPDQGMGMSLASGDLTEIAVDLLQVLQLFDAGAPDDALWEFRFGYQSHWGRHAHEVRTFLHTLAAY